MTLSPASGLRHSIAHMLQSRKDGNHDAYEDALRHLFKALREESSRRHIYKCCGEPDRNMVKLLQELLCSSVGIDEGKSVMMNLLTALLFVELGRDVSAHHEARKEVISHLPPKRVKFAVSMGAPNGTLGIEGNDLCYFIAGVKHFLEEVDPQTEDAKKDVRDAKQAFRGFEISVTKLVEQLGGLFST